MSRYVVDASVAIKWFLPELHDAPAARLRGDGTRIDAPDLIHAEVGNALWKRVRRGELAPDDADRICVALARLPLETHPSRLLAGAAFRIATTTGLTVYDALYLATALLTESPLVTADRRLFETAQRTVPLRGRVLWVEEVPA